MTYYRVVNTENYHYANRVGKKIIPDDSKYHYDTISLQGLDVQEPDVYLYYYPNELIAATEEEWIEQCLLDRLEH